MSNTVFIPARCDQIVADARPEFRPDLVTQGPLNTPDHPPRQGWHGRNQARKGQHQADVTERGHHWQRATSSATKPEESSGVSKRIAQACKQSATDLAFLYLDPPQETRHIVNLRESAEATLEKLLQFAQT